GGGRWGLASVPSPPDFRLGRGFFGFAPPLASPAGILQHADSLSPGCGIADANRRRPGLRVYTNQLPAAVFAHGARQRIGAGGLDDGNLRHGLDQAKVAQFHESLAERRPVAEVPAGDDYVIGSP